VQIVKHIYYNNDGLSKNIYYRLGESLHREDGPAVIAYDRDGVVVVEGWYYNNMFHRVGGPAVTYYRGKYKEEHFYINGNKYKEVDYKNYFNNIEHQEEQELLVNLGQTFD